MQRPRQVVVCAHRFVYDRDVSKVPVGSMVVQMCLDCDVRHDVLIVTDEEMTHPTHVDNGDGVMVPVQEAA